MKIKHDEVNEKIKIKLSHDEMGILVYILLSVRKDTNNNNTLDIGSEEVAFIETFINKWDKV